MYMIAIAGKTAGPKIQNFFLSQGQLIVYFIQFPFIIC